MDGNKLGRNGLCFPLARFTEQLIYLFSSLVRTAYNASDMLWQSLWNHPLHILHSMASDSTPTSLLQSGLTHFSVTCFFAMSGLLSILCCFLE